MQEWGFLGVTWELFARDLKYCSTGVFRKKFNSEGLQTYESHENYLIKS